MTAMDRTARRAKLASVALVAGLLIALAGVAYSVVQGVQGQEESDAAQEKAAQDNRLTNFTACVQNANPLRLGLRGFINQQIQNARETDPSLFPDIPKPVFERLLHRRIEQLRRIRDKNFALVNCLERFPPLLGQRYPHDLLAQARDQARRHGAQILESPSGGNAAPEGGGTSAGNSPSSPPAPAGGGGTETGGGGAAPEGGSETPPPPTPNPPDPPPTPQPPPVNPAPSDAQPGVLDPVTEHVSGVECHLNVLGVQVCN